MKKVLSSFGFIMVFLSVFATEYKEVPTEINTVTVYSRGAEIHRKGALNLTKGVHELKFPELSQSFDGNSIQVKGIGDFTILSVNSGYDYLRNRPVPSHIDALKDSLQWAQKEIQSIGSDRSIYTQEKKLVESNRNVGSNQQGVTAEELRKLADFYRSRLFDIQKKLDALDYRNAALSKTVNRINKQLQEWNVKLNQRFGEIYVTVSANASTRAKFELEYLVNDASWNPTYNIRSEGSGDNLQVDYLANVTQNTGEDWSNIKLNISTGNPMRNASKPELHPWLLNFMEFKRAYNKVHSQSNRSFELNEVMIVKDASSAPSAQKAKTASSFTNMMEGQLATTFEIDLPYSIPSDGKFRTVKIRELDIPAKYAYYAAPKLSNDVFLLAKISDWNNFNLMPGNANIFFEGSFVTKTYLNTFTTDDTLKIALGVDDRIAISRNRVEDFTKSTLVGAKKVETIGIEIKLRNSKNVPVEIVVQDQHPISGNKEIDISLDRYDEGKVNEETGFITWKMKLKAGENASKQFQYTVKYPKDKKINL